jgi:hypothetical protein
MGGIFELSFGLHWIQRIRFVLIRPYTIHIYTMEFTLPPVRDNQDGSWGPSTSTAPDQFKE